ncbi:PDZ domain-containing protein [Desulfobacterales bacterium HSG17]|nr:PDZ domain-containing protein [Desulfobacterales bacterium HSG17]
MKIVFTIINIFLIAAIAYSLIATGYKNLIVVDFTTPEQQDVKSLETKILSSQAPTIIDKKLTDIIVKRNLFRVDIEKENISLVEQKSKDTDIEKLEPTQLKLVLWGTVTGQKSVYAVIEDKENRKQALYQPGDLIQGAKLKKILSNQVILSHQGKDQLLEIQTDLASSGSSKKNSQFQGVKEATKVNPVPVNKITGHDVPDNLADFSTMMRQIKFRPHFSQGEADGLMVYGIRPNSVFMKIGLKNGDVIKTINDEPIISGEDILSQFYNTQSEENLRFTLLRRGNIKELSYAPSIEHEGG